jgi:DNA-binding XRE family transcriptional regulator
MKEMDVFIRNLKNLAIDQKLKQGDLAKKLGVTQTCVNLILNQKQNVSMAFALKVCDAFGVTMQQMFTPDPKQFGIKEDIQDSNKDAIIQFQQSQIESLEDELFELKKEIDRATFKVDTCRTDKIIVEWKDNKRVLRKNGTEFEIKSFGLETNDYGCILTAAFIADEVLFKG